ncbi:MAG: integrase core domain-containing protein [Polyangia bacterium]|jgi:hypothetical protein
MIEAWWRSLKHRWLYLHQLESFVTLEKLIAFYVEQHNSVVPHSAFGGQTPDEMYFGRGEQIPVNLAAARTRAREARMKANRNLSCTVCQLPLSAPVAPQIPLRFPTCCSCNVKSSKCFEPQLGDKSSRRALSGWLDLRERHPLASDDGGDFEFATHCLDIPPDGRKTTVLAALQP